MKIVKLLQQNAPNNAAGLGEIMRMVSRNVRASDPLVPRAFPLKLKLWDLWGPEVYVQVFAAATRFALFPDAGRSMYAPNFNCAAKDGAWKIPLTLYGPTWPC